MTEQDARVDATGDSGDSRTAAGNQRMRPLSERLRIGLNWPSQLLVLRRSGLSWREAWRVTHWLVWYRVTR